MLGQVIKRVGLIFRRRRRLADRIAAIRQLPHARIMSRCNIISPNFQTSLQKGAFARVLDTAASRQAAAAVPATFWFAMPPYSITETVAYLQEHQISVLISKDSGARGGVPETPV